MLVKTCLKLMISYWLYFVNLKTNSRFEGWCNNLYHFNNSSLVLENCLVKCI